MTEQPTQLTGTHMTDTECRVSMRHQHTIGLLEVI